VDVPRGAHDGRRLPVIHRGTSLTLILLVEALIVAAGAAALVDLVGRDLPESPVMKGRLGGPWAVRCDGLVASTTGGRHGCP
jgi:hypothetical protein